MYLSASQRSKGSTLFFEDYRTQADTMYDTYMYMSINLCGLFDLCARSLYTQQSKTGWVASVFKCIYVRVFSLESNLDVRSKYVCVCA